MLCGAVWGGSHEGDRRMHAAAYANGADGSVNPRVGLWTSARASSLWTVCQACHS
jgi:hypothetical protein